MISTSHAARASEICRFTALAIALLAGCSHGPASGSPPDAAGDATSGAACPALLAPTAASGWIFQARVTALHQATESQPPDWADPQHVWDPSKMAIVQIESVATQPSQDPLPPGTLDTIIFQDPPTFDVGYEGYFFVTAFIAGNTWVFLEQAHVDASTVPYTAFAAWVAQTEQYVADDALYERLVGAHAVARATVVSTADLPGQPIVDDGPHWRQAQITPQAILRGTLRAGDVPVRFDASDDFCCYQRPKLAVGDDAVYLLYPDSVSGLPGSSFVVVQASDVQPASSQATLAALLGSPPACPPWPGS